MISKGKNVPIKLNQCPPLLPFLYDTVPCPHIHSLWEDRDSGRPCDGAELPRTGRGRWLCHSSRAITDAIAARVLAAGRRLWPLERSAGAGGVPARGGQPIPPATAQGLCSRFAAPVQVRWPTPGLLPVTSVHRAGGGGPSSLSVGLLRVWHPPPGELYANQSCRRDCLPVSLSHGGHPVAGQSAGLQSLLARDYPPEFWAGFCRRPGALPRPL